MTKNSGGNEHIDDLLESDDDLLTPDESQETQAGAASKPAAGEQPEPEAEEPAPQKPTPSAKTTEPKADQPAQPAKEGRGSLGVLLIAFIVLILAVVGLGWYASHLRSQVSELKDSVDAATVKAEGAERTASSVANELLGTARECALVAKARAEAGNTSGAQADLAQARQFNDALKRLGASDSATAEVQALIAQAEQALAGETPEEAPSGDEQPDAQPDEGAAEAAETEPAEEVAPDAAAGQEAGDQGSADPGSEGAETSATVADEMIPSST